MWIKGIEIENIEKGEYQRLLCCFLGRAMDTNIPDVFYMAQQFLFERLHVIPPRKEVGEDYNRSL